MEQDYQIKLPLFKGPLDLLLHLIREHKLDIYDIPISLITKQYLEYIEMMKELNLDIAGDFLVMAATLIHIKSRMLLPIEDTADTEEFDDPRLELVMKLIEYKTYKEAALGLQEYENEHSEVFTRENSEVEGEDEDEAPDLSLFDLNLFDLITSFQRMLEKAPPEIQAITRETLTVKDKMSMLISRLENNDVLSFESIFEGDVSKVHFVVTFVAMLEMIRLGLAKVYQEREFSTIWIINPEANVNLSTLRHEIALDTDKKEYHLIHIELPIDKIYQTSQVNSFSELRTLARLNSIDKPELPSKFSNTSKSNLPLQAKSVPVFSKKNNSKKNDSKKNRTKKSGL